MDSVRSDENPMDVYFLTPYDLFPNGNNSVDFKWCEALSDCGAKIALYSPLFRKSSAMRSEPSYEFFGVRNSFEIKRIAMPFREVRQATRISSVYLFFWHLWNATRNVPLGKVAVISRSGLSLLPYIIVGKISRKKNLKCFVSAHEYIPNVLNKVLYRYCDGVLATNGSIVDDIKKNLNLQGSKFLISFNPPKRINPSTTDKLKLRESLSLPIDRKIVCYGGEIYKGQRRIEYFAEAARRLPDYLFLAVGGPHSDKFAEMYREIDNLKFTGAVPSQDFLDFHLASDLLISYDSAHDRQLRYNLPTKTGFYMMTGVPMIVADEPCIQGIVGDCEAVKVPPDDVDLLVREIASLLSDEKRAIEIGKNARNKIQRFTIDKMALRVFEFISSNFESDD